MAEAGRGAQVRLSGRAREAARGAVAASVEGNSGVKRPMDAAGDAGTLIKTTDPDSAPPAVVAPVAAVAAVQDEDPVPAAIAAIEVRITNGRAARMLLTDRVTALEGRAAVPGPAGPAGKDGAAGAASTVAGPVGPVGPAGPAGADGKSITGPAGPVGPAGAASTVAGPKGDAGQVGAVGPAGARGADGALSIQRARLTTAADGTVTWTYPTPFAAGVVPILSALPEAPAGAPLYSVQVDGTPTNTSVKFRVMRATANSFNSSGSSQTIFAVGTVPLHVSAVAPT